MAPAGTGSCRALPPSRGGAGLQGPLALAVTCTVVGSILLHGLSAEPLARASGARMRGEP